MATTTYGSPYVDGTDLVANWPAASLTVAQSIDAAGYYIGRGNNTQTGSYTTVLTDAGKVITMSNASANTVTIPANSSVAYVIGTRINILNLGAGACTPTAAAGVTINGTITALATNSSAAVIKTATNTWSYVPFSSGVGAAVYSDANTGTYTGFAYKTFTGSGTLTVTTAGFADMLLMAGGGAGSRYTGSGGGGAGGCFNKSATSVYLPAGTLTVTVGAGGAGSTTVNNTPANGTESRLGYYSAPGGGVGSSGGGGDFGGTGGCGGGAGSSANGAAYTTGGVGSVVNGNNGGNSLAGTYQAGGGGGGTGAVGANAAGVAAGAGGDGIAITIAGTTPSGAYVAGNYLLGGGGGGAGYSVGGYSSGAGGSGGGGAGSSTASGTNGTVNTGAGGGGSDDAGSTYQGGNGGSGIVIIRVAV